MHITELIKNCTDGVPVSVEIIPPIKGAGWQEIRDVVAELKNCGVSFVSVTSHAHEKSIEQINGKTVIRIKKKRLDTNQICLNLKSDLGVEVMPHLICSGFSKDEIEDALVNLHYFGVSNVLALRGDVNFNPLPFEISQLKNCYAADLVEQIVALNNGRYLDPVANSVKTNFCIGVAGYPEKHHEAADFESDLKKLKEKVDKGADFIITQMFFDNQFYYRFVDAARKIGIRVPIIPGIKPVYKFTHIISLPKIFHLGVPKALKDVAEKFSTKEDFWKAGTQYTVNQCNDLLKNGAPSLHFYTMSTTDPTVQILKSINYVVK